MARALIFGGGGVTHGVDPNLEIYLMNLLPTNPKIGYIGLANGDNSERIRRCEMRFTTLGAKFSYLPQRATASEALIWIKNLNAIYIGGGNTNTLLQSWRATGIDQVMREAAASSILLSGVSAGAMCWFEQAVWDGGGTQFQPLNGLGVFKGSCCVHCTTEPERYTYFKNAIRYGELGEGFAIGDGAGLYIENDTILSAITARENTGVWRASLKNGDIILDQIDQTFLSSYNRES